MAARGPLVAWSSGGRWIVPLPHTSKQASLAAGEGDCSAADWMEALRAAIRAQGPFTFAYQNPQACTTYRRQCLYRGSKKDDTPVHHTETTPYRTSPRGLILHPLFPSPSQTLTRSTHAYAESGSLATCLHLDEYFARKSWTRPNTTPLHAHVVFVHH